MVPPWWRARNLKLSGGPPAMMLGDLVYSELQASESARLEKIDNVRFGLFDDADCLCERLMLGEKRCEAVFSRRPIGSGFGLCFWVFCFLFLFFELLFFPLLFSGSIDLCD